MTDHPRGSGAVHAPWLTLTCVQAWRVAGVESEHSGQVAWWNWRASKRVVQVRKHAVWESRWETYLKLCRTTWDRKWDTVNGFAVKSPCQTTLYNTAAPTDTLTRTRWLTVESISLFSLEYWCFLSGFHEIGKRFARSSHFIHGSHLCLLRTCLHSCCTGWNL